MDDLWVRSATLALCAGLCPYPSFAPHRPSLRCPGSADRWASFDRAGVEPRVGPQRCARALDPQGRTPLGRLAHRFCNTGRRRREPHSSRRISFAKIPEPLEVPDLLALQTESFDWLLGNADWQARVAAAAADGRQDVPGTSGLEEIFEEISPIEDFGGTMSLSFRDHRFEPPKYSVEECKEKDFTYAAPLFVTAEFMNNTTGEIKSQTVFMGDFPLMTERGTFIINGTERVVVSQLVRSPGRVLRAHRRQDVRQGHLHRARSSRPAVPGSSSRSTSATSSASASTASASSPSPCSSRRSA